MDITGGLMALANAGTGYFNQQHQNQQLNYQNQMQALALHNAQQRDAQNTKGIQDAQAASDDAMAVSAGLVHPTGGMPGQTTPNPGDTSTAPPQQQDPSSVFSQLAQKALARGDLTTYAQLSTNSINAKNDQLKQQGTAATAQLTTLKATQLGASVVGSIFSGVTDQSSYDAARMQAASDSSLPADIRANMAKLPASYDPAIVNRVMQTGQTVAQQASENIKSLTQQASQSHQEGMLAVAQQRAQLDEQRTAAYVAHQSSQAKVGAGEKAPSPQELKVAAPLIAKVWFPDNPNAATSNGLFQGPAYDPGDTGKDSGHFKEPKYDFSSIPVTTIVSRAKQAMQGNRALTFNQAVAQQAQMAKDSGEFKQTTTPAKTGGFLGIGDKPASTESKFNAGDGSAAHPNIFHGQPKEDLVVGQHYQTGSGTMMWTKDGWVKQ